MSRTVCSATQQFRPRVEALEERLVLTTAQYVNSVYVDLLLRSPQASEVTSGAQQLNSNVTPFQFAVNLLNTPEFITNDVYNDYGAYLNRLPSSSEVNFWVGQRQAGVSAQAVAANFLGSLEFFQQNGNFSTTWLSAVYVDVLGHGTDPTGQAFWVQQLNAGESRISVAFSIITSLEGESRTVAAAYLRVLQRQVDPSGLMFWTAQMNAGLSPTALLADLASSPEFVDIQANGSLDTRTITTLIVSTPGGTVPSKGGAASLPLLGFGPVFATAAQLNETFRSDTFTSSPFTGSLGG